LWMKLCTNGVDGNLVFVSVSNLTHTKRGLRLNTSLNIEVL